jgi:tetratricopeptide (TPR) repeat protein
MEDADGRLLAARRAARRLLVVVLLVLAGLVLFTGVIAGAYHQARRDRAAALFARGEGHLRAQQPRQALDPLRTAVALMPSELAYRRTLAFALTAAGHQREARAHLASLLGRDPVDGEANLLMARLERAEPRIAEQHYQRAIYGRWPGSDAAARRLDVRFELVDFLAVHNRTTMRAELLRLAAELPDEPARQFQLAVRWTRAGDLEAALGLYRTLARRLPDEPRAHAGVSATAFALGRYREARQASARVLALDPDDAEARVRLEQATDVLARNPLAPRLRTAERRLRARRLVDAVAALLEACRPPPGQAPSPADVARALSAARAQMAALPARASAEDVDALLDTTQLLWSLAGPACTAQASPALRLIVGELGREAEEP